ncbi:LysE family transporter [Thalassomonas actiniarum]|uniref:LysE family transporter n=1 Tax=Thalassomonas actiniarum TaxID=485447 RepID=A0AAE9YPQ9_9GAMM|nr:LysE family transporter [Thalassomonas actiniarum]WDD98975.1 LysE family transporter [Thalassomonas actiniarum]
MDLFTGLLLITSIHLLAAASPGPDFVLVSQQTLRNGKKTGLLISLGITLGLSIHIIYSAFGLAAVIANSSMALWAIKIFGGGYLLYLGYQGLRSKAQVQSTMDTQADAAQITRPGSAKSIGLGFLCNALNPKAPVYFVSLFTLVLSPDMPLYQIAVYGVWMMVIQLAWFSSVVMLLSRPKVNAGFQRFGHWIDRILGGAMILLGIKLLTTKIN